MLLTTNPGDKSWWLSDAQELADEFPYTFHKPSPEAIALLQVGDGVKLIFRFESNDPEAPNAERMWVEITGTSESEFEGTLDNDPLHITDISSGDPIHFDARHIIQVSIVDPVAAKTDQFLPRCFVTSKVLYDGVKIGYLYRETPDNEEDSGWRILAGDETDDYMNDADNLHFVSLGAVLREDDRILALLKAPAGSSFEWHEAQQAFVAIEN